MILGRVMIIPPLRTEGSSTHTPLSSRMPFEVEYQLLRAAAHVEPYLPVCAACFRMFTKRHHEDNAQGRYEALNVQDGILLNLNSLMEFCSSRARLRRIQASSVGGITLLP